jgi:carbonic anhydrase
VTNVVVCGHTQCGAVNAILNPESMDRLPFVKRWLAQGERVRAIVAERYAHLPEEARMLAAVEENVLVQLENLRAFPNVATRLEAGTLTMAGWVYDIATGDVWEYEPHSGQFGPIAAASVPPAPPAR